MRKNTIVRVVEAEGVNVSTSRSTWASSRRSAPRGRARPVPRGAARHVHPRGGARVLHEEMMGCLVARPARRVSGPPAGSGPGGGRPPGSAGAARRHTPPRSTASSASTASVPSSPAATAVSARSRRGFSRSTAPTSRSPAARSIRRGRWRPSSTATACGRSGARVDLADRDSARRSWTRSCVQELGGARHRSSTSPESTPRRPRESSSEEDWRQVIDVNLSGAFWLSQAAGAP